MVMKDLHLNIKNILLYNNHTIIIHQFQIIILKPKDPILLSEPISICSQLPVDVRNYIIVYNNTASNISNKLINDDNITLFKIFISNTNINFDNNNIEENIKEGDIINVEVIKNYAKLVDSK